MKKTTAVILSILLVFSIFSCAIFAQAEDTLPSPDDITYVEPSYPAAEKTGVNNLLDSIFGSLAADQNGPFAQFISAMRNFFEQALGFLQPIIENFTGSFDPTDTSALQTIVRNLVAAFR